MSNPPRKKGTAGETELVGKLAEEKLIVFRQPAGNVYDLGRGGLDPAIEVLATRPDRGQWLVTLRLADFAELVKALDRSGKRKLHIEVKRYAKVAIHTIYEGKFPRKEK